MTMTHALQPQPITHQSRTPQSHTPRIDVESPAPTINLLVAGALAIAIVAVLLVGFGSDAAADGPVELVSAQSELVGDTIEVYTVLPGDTLWAIATEIGHPGEDIRPIVDALAILTGGAQLEIGQQIVIDHASIRG